MELRIREVARLTAYELIEKNDLDFLAVKRRGALGFKYTQKFLGTVTDGIVSNQLNSSKKYMPNMLSVSWEFENIPKGGSAMIKALQKLIGAKVDGYAGKDTIKYLQIFLKKKGYYTGKIDCISGPATVVAWQKYLNAQF